MEEVLIKGWNTREAGDPEVKDIAERGLMQ